MWNSLKEKAMDKLKMHSPNLTRENNQNSHDDSRIERFSKRMRNRRM